MLGNSKTSVIHWLYRAVSNRKISPRYPINSFVLLRSFTFVDMMLFVINQRLHTYIHTFDLFGGLFIAETVSEKRISYNHDFNCNITLSSGKFGRELGKCYK